MYSSKLRHEPICFCAFVVSSSLTSASLQKRAQPSSTITDGAIRIIVLTINAIVIVVKCYTERGWYAKSTETEAVTNLGAISIEATKYRKTRYIIV